MGVRARRWQLWLITTFILTGIIGMIQLFKGPDSAEAVTIAGVAVNSAIGLPTRSGVEQATQLPAWTPTDDTTAKTTAGNASPANPGAPRVAAATARPTVVIATGPVSATTSRTSATQLPSITVPQTTAATKATSVVAKTVTTSANPTTAKPTTKPVATTSTTTVKPTPTPVRTTAAVPTKARPQQPTTGCSRILWWARCR